MSNLTTEFKAKQGDKTATGTSGRYPLDLPNEEELLDFPPDESWFISPSKEQHDAGGESYSLAFKYSIGNSAFDVLPNQRRGGSIAFPKDEHNMSKTPGPFHRHAEVSSSFPGSSSLAAATDDLSNEQHLNSFIGHKPSSSSPDVLGIVSHLWSQSPVTMGATDRTPLTLRQVSNETQGSGSPISKRYFDAFCAPLLTTETPLFDHLRETVVVDDENYANVNCNLFVSDLSVNAPSWPGAAYFDNKSSATVNEQQQKQQHHQAPSTSPLISNSDVLAAAFERNEQRSKQQQRYLQPPKQSAAMPVLIPRRGGISPPPRNDSSFASQKSSSVFNNDDTSSSISDRNRGLSSSMDGSAFLRPKPSQERVILRNSFDFPRRINNNKQQGQQQPQQTAANRIAARYSQNLASLSLDLDHIHHSNSNNNNSSSPHHLRGSHDSNNSSNNNSGSYYQPPHHHHRSNNSITTKVVNSSSAGHISSLDFIESPRSKHAFKEFMTNFRIKCKESTQIAEGYALKLVTFTMPEHAKWRVYVELAELAKKCNDYHKAREWYIQACISERRAASTWLEWSKMEEENGHLILAIQILNMGVIICKLNETLLPRMIKLRERLHQYSHVRDVLSVLKYESLERAWRSILEGSLFEARIGHSEVAKEIFKYLIRHVPWYGPIYYDAYRLEEREQRDEEALKIIHRGLHELPRYGPLWFGLIHITERLDQRNECRLWVNHGHHPQLIQVQLQCQEAIRSISKELTWRVHYERFCIEERSMEIAAFGRYNSSSTHNNNHNLLEYRREMSIACRHSLTQALLLCANNIRWKILLIGARFELGLANIPASKILLQRALIEVPSKSKSSVIIECSRHEEYSGNIAIARRILYKARNENISDWRVFLESILLELRSGDLIQAIHMAKMSVRNHPGTGRVWALCIQLYHRYEGCHHAISHRRVIKNVYADGVDDLLSLSLSQSLSLSHQTLSEVQQTQSQTQSLKEMAIRQAIHEVPKSGEVWCEQGRCCFNPLLLHCFDLQLAQLSFVFAMQFTPQFGDTFVEYQRWELIIRSCLHDICCEVLQIDFVKFVSCVLNCDQDGDLLPWISSLPTSGASLETASSHGSRREEKIGLILRLQQQTSEEGVKRLRLLEHDTYPQLLRRCGNADPNYGPLWYHCHNHPEDIPLLVMQRARKIILHELSDAYPLYLRAVLCFVMRIIDRDCQRYNQQDQQMDKTDESSNSSNAKGNLFIMDDSGYHEMQILLHEYNHAMKVWLEDEQEEDRAVFTSIPNGGEMFTVSDFVTGIVEVNRVITGFAHWHGVVSDEMKRRFLFGVDQIV